MAKSTVERYHAAAIQTAFENPRTRAEIPSRVARMIAMAEQTVAGYGPFFDVRLVVFPEFAHAAPCYFTTAELDEHLAVEIPNDHTDAYQRFSRKTGCFVQTGSFIERDPKYPGALFNTTCLIGPDGILSKYRKVNPWIPWEVHASPHDIAGYTENPFPVADTEIGKLGCAICYDWLFPESIRQLAFNGAEVLIRISAYMDPWGATAPMDWWTTINRARAIENTAFVVACNQGASFEDIRRFPGRVARWALTSMGAFSRRLTRARARRWWWFPSISALCARPGSDDADMTCERITARRFTPTPRFRASPAQVRRRSRLSPTMRASPRRSARLIESRILRPCSHRRRSRLRSPPLSCFRR